MWIRTKAIILFSSPVGESDLLLVLFTEKLGKIRAMAKGALRSRKRFAGILLNLNLVRIELIPSRRSESGYLLNLAEPVKSRFSLSKEPERLASAYALAELIEKATPELAPDPALFHLLEASLDQLGDSKNFRETLFYFLLQILDQLGYPPSLDCCASCGKKIAAGASRCFFSVNKGGLVCEDCRVKNKNLAQEIPAGFGRTLRALKRSDPAKASRVRISNKDWRLGLELFRDFISWHPGKSMLSLGFLKELAAEKK